MELFKKYEFNSKEQAEQKIASLPHIEVDGHSYLKDNHAIVHIGHIITNEPIWDDENDGWLVEPEYADKYSVDVLWNDLDESPYGWKSYEITVEGNGVHTFLGRNF